MNSYRAFKIGKALNSIAMRVDDETLAKIKPYMDTIESEVLEMVKEKEEMMEAQEKDKLEARYKDLEEREFQLKMKDSWDAGDGQIMSQIHTEMADIKRKLEAFNA